MLKKFDQNVSEGFLFTDQYELVMAQFYFRLGLHNNPAQFEHYFRNYPDYGTHKAGYCINAGLEWFVEWMTNTSFSEKDYEYLSKSKNIAGKKVFDEKFLTWLKDEGNYSKVSIRAIPEGRVVHPNLPLTIVRGPLAIVQILETALLNQLNYQILIATKASRIKVIGRGQPLFEFGARRAQDRGAIAGARAALIGGADFSSNVGISHLLGIPPKGTHAHSMVQLFIAMGRTEEEAFQEFADMYPDECILLVDTINTLESGVPNAIKVFQRLKKKGHKPIGVRLDSGDLAYLSIKVAKMLDKAGLPEVGVVLSNELDEMNIWQIISQIAEDAPKQGVEADSVIGKLIFGVGTRLVTSSGDSALGGVYKLISIKKDNRWQQAIKISDAVEKMTNPGDKQVWRLYDKTEKATADMICLAEENPKEMELFSLRHPLSSAKFRSIARNEISKIEPLLIDIIKDGKVIYNFPSIEELRNQRKSDLEKLDSGVKRLINPHYYHVSLSQKLWNLKEEMIKKTKK